MTDKIEKIERLKTVAKDVFDLYDVDKNGYIDKSELKPLLNKLSKQLGLPEPNDQDIDDGIKQLDFNKDGKLQFKEFFPFYQQVYEHIMDKI